MNTANEQQPEQPNGTPQEQPEQRKAPGRPFEAGDPRINRAGRPKKGAERPEQGGQAVFQEAGEPLSTLEEMRRITREPASMDRTEYQRKLRKLFDDDFKTFMAQLTTLEKAEAGKKPAGGEDPAEEEVDQGTEAAIALGERWLREQGAKHAE